MADLIGGTVVWNLDVNLKKFSDGLASAKANIQKFSDDGRRNFDKVEVSASSSLRKAEHASQVFATGLLAVGASMATVLGIGIKTAAEFETLTTALQTVTGSSEKAAEAMKTIKQVAKDSPFFEVGTLAQFTQLMAASGQSIEEAVASGIKFGDVAAAFGKGNAEMTRMGNTLSQVMGKGKADIVDFKELVNAGWVSVRKDTAAAMGVTMAQFEDMVSAGEVGYEQIAKAAEKFTGAAENQSKSFSALMGRLKETISTTFAELVIDTGIFDIAKNALNQIIVVLDSIDTKQVAEMFKNFADNLPIIAGAITGALIPAFYAWGIAMIPVITALIASTIALLPWIALGALVGLAIKLLVDNFDKLKDAAKRMADVVTGAFDLIVRGDFKGKFGRATGLDEDSPIITAVLGFRNKIKDTFQSIKDLFIGFKNSLVENADKIRDVFLVLSGPVGWAILISENFDAIKAKAIEFKDSLILSLGSLVESVGVFFSELPAKIAYGLGFALGTIISWGESVINFFTTTIPSWIETIGFFFVGLGLTITTALQEMLVSITIWGIETITYFQENIPLWIESIVAWFSQLPIRIWEVLVSLYNRFVAWGVSTWNYLLTTVTSWITNLVAWFKALPGKISEALSTLHTSIKQRFTEAWSAILAEVSSWPQRLMDWGRNIANAFVQGIKDGLKALAGAFKDGLNAARGSVEGKSPPKEGPYKDIDKWGFNVGTAWVEGMTMAMSQIDSKIGGALGFGNLNINRIPTPDTGSSGFSDEVTNNTNNNQITVNIGQVNDVEDLDMLNREIGFRLGVTPT